MVNQQKKSEFILQCVNMFLFHSHILLRKSDETSLISQDERANLKLYFFNLLKNENSLLPSDYCLEVFFKYLMYEEALLFLFYRREYSRLINLIHDQYKEENKAIAKLEQKISSLESLAAAGDPVEKQA